MAHFHVCEVSATLLPGTLIQTRGFNPAQLGNCPYGFPAPPAHGMASLCHSHLRVCWLRSFLSSSERQPDHELDGKGTLCSRYRF